MRLLALALCASQLAAQPVQLAVLVEEAFQLSGVRNQVQQLPGQFQQQFEEQIGKLPAAQREKTAPLLRKVLNDFIEPESLYRQLKINFIANIEAKKLQAAIEWLRSPIARRMQKLEDYAYSREGKQKLEQFAADIQSTTPAPQRVNLMRDLDQAVNGSAFATDLLVEVARDVTEKIVPSGASAKELNRDLAELRGASHPMMVNMFILQSLFMYQPVIDEELKQYITARRSEIAQWYTRRLQETLLRTLSMRAAKAAADFKGAGAAKRP